MPKEDENIYFSSDLWRGGVISLVFESDEIPTPEDFSISFLEVETPDEDWSLVNGYYFRGSKITIYHYLALHFWFFVVSAGFSSMKGPHSLKNCSRRRISSRTSPDGFSIWRSLSRISGPLVII